jgi:hypothetical protein
MKSPGKCMRWQGQKLIGKRHKQRFQRRKLCCKFGAKLIDLR